MTSERLRSLIENLDHNIAPADIHIYAESRKLVEEFFGKKLTDEEWEEVHEELAFLVEITPPCHGPEYYASIEDYDRSQPRPHF